MQNQLKASQLSEHLTTSDFQPHFDFDAFEFYESQTPEVQKQNISLSLSEDEENKYLFFKKLFSRNKSVDRKINNLFEELLSQFSHVEKSLDFSKMYSCYFICIYSV